MKTILLSIKPEYVEKIIEGTKKYEYRKRIAQNLTATLLIYCTAPEMRIVAEVKVINTIQAAPSTLWEQTKHNAGISREKYREYFHGCKTAYAYELGDVEIFNPPHSLSDYNITVPPQSFVYVDTRN